MTSSPMFLYLSLLLFLASDRANCLNFALETNEVSDQFLPTSINFIFDMILKHFTKNLVEEGKTQIAIGGFERRFAAKVLTMDIEGAIEVEDGWCGNISTLHRTGDADMSRGEGDTILTSHVGLADLKIDFNDYDVSLLGVHQKGKIHVAVGENSIWLKLTVQLKPTCVVTLTEFKIERMENIRVDITNLGPFENLTDEIVSVVVNEVSTKFRGNIEEALLPVLSKALQTADICHYIPF